MTKRDYIRYGVDEHGCIVPSCCDVCQTMKNEKLDRQLAEQQAAKNGRNKRLLQEMHEGLKFHEYS